MLRLALLALVAAGCRTTAVASEPARPPSPDPVPSERLELSDFRSRINDLLRRQDEFARQAHEALAAAKYDVAVSLHRQSVELGTQAEQLRAAMHARVREIAERLVRDLDHEEIATREAANRELLGLRLPGSVLRELASRLSGEARLRLDQILRRRQWAKDAMASSEYGRPQWAASQATGAPDTLAAGDYQTAWATRAPDGGHEWIELTFDLAVEPELIRIHETYNAGAIIKVEARDAQRAWRTVWEGSAAAADTPRWLEIPVASRDFTTSRVRLTLDSAAVQGWNEIDAVELVGTEP